MCDSMPMDDSEMKSAGDVDLTLLRENLKLTPAQRLEKFASFMRFVSELQLAGEVARGAKLKTKRSFRRDAESPSRLA
jgi:hypothetical protein